MSQRSYVIDTLISAKSIAARIEVLAKEIEAEFAGTQKLVVVGLLRGSFIFIADLVRELDLPVEVDFVEASSYGNATTSSREVRILKDLRGDIEGRDVLVVEDIVDTGHTLAHVLTLLGAGAPRGCAPSRCWTSRRGARPISAPTGPGSRSPTSSSSATGSITRSATATCPLSGRCGSPTHDHHVAPADGEMGAPAARPAHGAALAGRARGRARDRGRRVFPRLAGGAHAGAAPLGVATVTPLSADAGGGPEAVQYPNLLQNLGSKGVTRRAGRP